MTDNIKQELSLDDADVGTNDSNPTPDFVLNKVPIPFAIWQHMKLLKDTYDMSKELTLDGYRDQTILSEGTIRQVLALHETYQPHAYVTLKRPLRDAKLENLLPARFVASLRRLWGENHKQFWNVYAASNMLCDQYMFEYISAFLATICRDADPGTSAEIVRQLLG